eukprot:scaffold75864_cov20-Tisochrysis_lutea.AAC.1
MDMMCGGAGGRGKAQRAKAAGGLWGDHEMTAGGLKMVRCAQTIGVDPLLVGREVHRQGLDWLLVSREMLRRGLDWLPVSREMLRQGLDRLLCTYGDAGVEVTGPPKRK